MGPSYERWASGKHEYQCSVSSPEQAILPAPAVDLPYFLAAAFLWGAGAFSLSRVRASAALNGYRRTDCCPVVLKVTSTRRF